MLWERQHRCWSELEKPSNALKSFQEKGGKGKGKGKQEKGSKGDHGKGDQSKSKGKGKGGSDLNQQAGKGKGVCYLCGKPGHFAKDCSKAKDIAQQERLICHKCGGKGHIASVCPSKSSEKGTSKGKSSKGKKGGKQSKGLIEESDPVPEPSPSNSDGENQTPTIQMSFIMPNVENVFRFEVCEDEPNPHLNMHQVKRPPGPFWRAYRKMVFGVVGSAMFASFLSFRLQIVFGIFCVISLCLREAIKQCVGGYQSGFCVPLLACSMNASSLDLSLGSFCEQLDQILGSNEAQVNCALSFAGLSGAKDHLSGDSNMDPHEPGPQSKPLPQIGLEDLAKDHFWLLDSGASAHVVREDDLKAFRVIGRKQIDAQFTAAHGNSIRMSEVPFIMLVPVGKKMVRRSISITLDAFVGSVQSNVLSVGALTQRGWEFFVTKAGGGLIHKRHSVSVPMVWFANCPWIASAVESTLQLKPRNKETTVMNLQLKPRVNFESQKEEEAHRLRGHLPPDPRHCPICAKVRGVSQSRRTDFCFVQIAQKSFKVLVLAHGETGCIGAAVCGASVNTTVQKTRDFFAFLGLTGAGPTVELTTDAEAAVSKIVKQCNLDGRHLVVQRAGGPSRTPDHWSC